MGNQKTIVCPECGNDIKLEEGRDYVVGDIIECEVCGSELEVVSIDDNGSIEIEVIEEEK
jgi:lysine biosynthesis protein LysW